MINEWLFRSCVRWGRAVGVEELKRLANENWASHVHGGGRMLTATTHGGKSAVFSFPAEMGVAAMKEILEKVIWFLDNHEEDEVDNYLRNYPSSTAHGWWGIWRP